MRGEIAVLSEIQDSQDVLTKIGKLLASCLSRIEHLKARIDLDEFVIMPNHFHAVIMIHDFGRGEAFEGNHAIQRMDRSNASPLRIL